MARRRGNTTITTTTTTSSGTRIVTRSIYKKQQLLLLSQQKTTKTNSKKVVDSTKSCIFNTTPTKLIKKEKRLEDDQCTTPKSEKFKIPEIVTCPPAPKKPRVSSSKNCLVHTRRPITFFAHPDLDKFFMFATRDTIKV